jgi:acyl-CoA hydrolase
LRQWPEDLNPNGTLFGGSLLRWIDEEAAIYAICQLDNQRVVTKFMSEINFVSSARQGDIIELGMTATHFGNTSITLRCEVRNKITRKSILTVEKMVFVNLNDGEPAPHGRTEVCYADEAFARSRKNISPVVQPPVGETDAVARVDADRCTERPALPEPFSIFIRCNRRCHRFGLVAAVRHPVQSAVSNPSTDRILRRPTSS